MAIVIVKMTTWLPIPSAVVSHINEKDITRMTRWAIGLGMMVLAMNAAHGQDVDASTTSLRSAYCACVKASRGVTSALNNCIGTEYDFQDKRLNTAYQRLRTTLSPELRTTLRDDERAWITKREATCATDGGGTANMLDGNQCRLDQTATRAALLEARARQ